jgi:biopolymer transport protein ExbD
MRIPQRPGRLAPLDGDAMTSMIDVVFLLLVFFICASIGSTADRLLPADLSGTQSKVSVETPPPPHTPVIRIELTPGPQGVSVRLDGSDLTDLKELTIRLNQLAQADAGARIVLDVDDALAMQYFISLYDLCQRLKFRNISIAIAPPPADAIR